MSKQASNKIKSCAGKESFERMNYLHQISQRVLNFSPVASAYYGNLMMNIAKRGVLRIDPHVKRTLCRRCRLPLIIGQTCKVSVSKKDKMMYHRCTKCFYLRKYPINKDHKLHTDNKEYIVEVLDYGQTNESVQNVNN
ncbi:ribonuclease P protein subunit rpr2 [Ctenocephalides felis]|uniref:ribonuclease P protein subunit rpr2 n=1 Tax=Ctenocephalides felis TaxID=7515 RepID=UPI000E6E1C89|nr:ribonuclease P protein subunit rpr2 [Ctenocephalides felis]